MKKNYFMKSIAAALLTGVVAMGGLTSCASDDDAVEQKPEVKPETFTYHVNIPATFGGDTRAVTFTDATTSSSYFEANAKIYAYLVPIANSLTAGYWSTAAPLTVSASSTFNVAGDTYTALTGDMTFTVEPQVNDEIILNYGINKDNTTDGDDTNNDRGRYYFDYTDQTGTAASASAHDFASARMKITAISEGEITLVRSEDTSSSIAVFKNLQSMFRLVPSFTNGGDAVSPAPTILSLKIEALDGNNNQKLATTCYQGGRTSDYMVLNTNFSTDPIYLALGFVSTSNKLRLTATDQTGNVYVCEKSTSFANGKYYSGNAEFTWQSKGAPVGAISGKFTISNDNGTTKRQVYFSKGNLQATYDGTAWSWAFAEHQWTYVGNVAANTAINGNGTVSEAGYNKPIDMFGWVGTSSSWTGAAQYGISDSKTAHYYGNSTEDELKSDWGTTMGDSWFTLTTNEWKYLFSDRTTGGTVGTTSQARFAMATIRTDDNSGVNGVILFPDGVNITNTTDHFTTLGTVNDANKNYATKCTSAQWTALEEKGCVFLPAAGSRWGDTVSTDGTWGLYWSSSPNESDETCAHYVLIYPDLHLDYSNNRYYGCSVRLVYQTE